MPPSTPPDLPWKVKLLVSTLSVAVDTSRRSDGGINRFIMNLLDFKASPSPKKPINGVMTTDITVDKSRDLWFRLYTPTATATATAGKDETSKPVIFYFHGGGFAFMAANSKPYDDFCRRLALELHAVIISVNYRLAPEHKYPCQYEDCLDVIKFIDNNTELEDLSRHAILKQAFVAGDSAGANIAHNVALKASEYEFSNVKIIGNISLQPFFGGVERTEAETNLPGAPFITLERTDWMWRAFLPEEADRGHPACNVFGPNSGDISGVKFPASIVVVGGFDPLKDWQKKYYEGLKRYGKEAFLVEYPNAIHTFYAYPEVPESSLFIEEVKNFIKKLISG